MYKDNHLRLNILGAGPAGLGAGFFGKKNNLPVSVYELTDSIGGNSRTIRKGEFSYDTGAHRLHDKYPMVTSTIKELLGNDLIKINVPSKIYYKGCYVDFPLNILNLIQNLSTKDLIKIGYENVFNSVNKNVDPKSFREIAYQNYGPTLSEMFLINYTEKLWGLDTRKLDKSISGKRLKNLNLFSVIKGMLTRNDNVGHLDGSFYYPKYGFGTIFDQLADNIGYENIFLKSRVKKLVHDGTKINEIVLNDNRSISPGMIINTLPLNILRNIFEPQPPKSVANAIKNIKFRNVRLCILYLNRTKFTSAASIYFPEPSFPYNRIYEPKNRSPYMAPKDQTCLVVECSVDQAKTRTISSNESFFRQIKDSLIKEGLIKDGDILGYDIDFIPNAYPIIELGIENKLIPVINYFNSFENHILHGRNAIFKYVHTHDLLKKSEDIIKELLDKQK